MQSFLTYREALITELTGISSQDGSASEDRKTVTLDQQAQGRLSRMDAMQRQAMAQAVERRRLGRMVKIKAALQRMEDGEFGFCLDCGDEIATARLDQDPTVPNCIDCARG